MKTKREIYSLSYQIDYWICIYEKLIELSESLSTITLTVLYAIPDLINLIYQDWLKEEDYSDDELTQSVMKSIRKIRNNAERSA